jgi:hypothetical protein
LAADKRRLTQISKNLFRICVHLRLSAARSLPFFLAVTGFSQSLVIRHVTIIDATGAKPIKNASVVVAGDRILAAGKKVRPPRGALVIEGKGKFLIPGLWDMHMHLPLPSPPLAQLLVNGITGVREMFTGVPLDIIRAWRTRPDVPRIIAAGFLDGPAMLSVGPPPPGAFAVANAAEARAAVRILQRSGYNFIKVYNNLPRDGYFTIAEESRALNIPFAGHVPEAVSVGEASDAGQRSQEHLINILLACSTREDELRAERLATMADPALSGEARLRLIAFPNPEGLFDTYSEEKAAALFAKFTKNGTWQTPTLVLLDAFLRRPEAARKQFYMKNLTTADFDALLARIRALLVRYQKLVGDMHRAGVPILAGTDSSAFTPILPGVGLHEELALLVDSAMYFGQLAALGTIEPGKSADLVLLDADPLKDIHNTQKIHAVVMRGRYFPREELDVIKAANTRE